MLFRNYGSFWNIVPENSSYGMIVPENSGKTSTKFGNILEKDFLYRNSQELLMRFTGIDQR